MLRKVISYFTLPLLLLLSNSPENSATSAAEGSQGQNGTLERMIVANGIVAMDLDLNRLEGISSDTPESRQSLRFEVSSASFFTILVFNNVVRTIEPGSMGLTGGNPTLLPTPLDASANQFVIERRPSEESFELVIRDGKTSFVFFNIEGHQYDYNPSRHSFSIKDGRLLMSEELA